MGGGHRLQNGGEVGRRQCHGLGGERLQSGFEEVLGQVFEFRRLVVFGALPQSVQGAGQLTQQRVAAEGAPTQQVAQWRPLFVD